MERDPQQAAVHLTELARRGHALSQVHAWTPAAPSTLLFCGDGSHLPLCLDPSVP